MNEELFQKCPVAKEFYNIPAVKKSLDCDNPVRGAFERAYFDTQRTLRGISKNSNHVQIKQSIFEIVSKFYEDFTKNIENYSLRDYDGSLGIIFDKIVSASETLGHKFTLGQAQKIVNMFFKYMLLVDDRLNTHLNYFHVPFDGVILNGIANGAYLTEMRTLAKACMPWSKMDDYRAYMNLQDGLRDVYENPIIFEFEAWNEWNDGATGAKIAY